MRHYLWLFALLLISCSRKDILFGRPMVIVERGDGSLTIRLPGRQPILIGNEDGLIEPLFLPQEQPQLPYLPALILPRGQKIPNSVSELTYLFAEFATANDLRHFCRLGVIRATIVGRVRGKIPQVSECRILGINAERYMDFLLDPPPRQPVIFFFSDNLSFSG